MTLSSGLLDLTPGSDALKMGRALFISTLGGVNVGLSFNSVCCPPPQWVENFALPGWLANSWPVRETKELLLARQVLCSVEMSHEVV